MNYPDYLKLYARYAKRSPKPLIDLAGNLTGKVVFDLCAGGGRLSEELLYHHPRMIVAIDKDFDMVSYCINGCRIINGELPDVLSKTPDMVGARADVVFCQQAINYWLSKNAAELLHAAMNQGGVFIFDTFNKKPSSIPQIKSYNLDSYDFVEVSWRIDDIVHHVQIRNGLEPHTNSFRWFSSERILEILSPRFSVESFINDNTTLYRCTSL